MLFSVLNVWRLNNYEGGEQSPDGGVNARSLLKPESFEIEEELYTT